MALNLVQIKQALEETRPTFEQMNMNKISFAKEMEWAMQAFEANKYLQGMEANTVKNCLVNIALTGLTLNPVMKQAYLVPRKGKCCVDPSYQGLIKIATDTGSVKSIKAKPVYSNEPFEIEQGTNGYVKHGICVNGKKGKRIGAYSIAVLNDGSNHVEWMYEEELMGIKGRSESVKSGKASPWDTDEDEMVRKTVVKRHWKYLPKSERALMMNQAIAFDDEHNGIDFDAERKEANRAAQQQGATPDAPEDEMATEEDYNTLMALFDDPVLADVVNLHYLPKVTMAGAKAGIIRRRDEDKLTKKIATDTIELLEAEKKIVLDAQKGATDEKA